jgi:hypothetical protein
MLFQRSCVTCILILLTTRSSRQAKAPALVLLCPNRRNSIGEY